MEDEKPTLESMFLNQVVSNFIVEPDDLITIELASGVFIRFKADENTSLGIPDLSKPLVVQ